MVQLVWLGCVSSSVRWHLCIPLSDDICWDTSIGHRNNQLIPGFLQVRENWKNSGNLSGRERTGENIFFWKSQGKWKIGATRCQISRLKFIKFDFRWGSIPDPAGEAYSAPSDPLSALNMAP